MKRVLIKALLITFDSLDHYFIHDSLDFKLFQVVIVVGQNLIAKIYSISSASNCLYYNF
jgi:hypothetical protein